MNHKAEMQWRSPVCRTFGSLKAGIRLPTSPFLGSFRFAEIRELRSIALVLWRHRGVDLRYFGHLPWIRNRFSARSYPLESTFMLVP